MSETKQTKVKLVVGKVISDKMDKTIVVRLEYLVKHPQYGKYIKRFTKLHAHDEDNQGKIGDIVAIAQASPKSKMKAWILVEVVKKHES